jgi:hypothetical protein
MWAPSSNDQQISPFCADHWYSCRILDCTEQSNFAARCLYCQTHGCQTPVCSQPKSDTGELPACVKFAAPQQLLVTRWNQTFLKVAITVSRTHVIRLAVWHLRPIRWRHLTRSSPCAYTIVAPLRDVFILTTTHLIHATTTLDVLSRGAQPSKASTSGSVPTTTILAFI